jgi:hypothetical protein
MQVTVDVEEDMYVFAGSQAEPRAAIKDAERRGNSILLLRTVEETETIYILGGKGE